MTCSTDFSVYLRRMYILWLWMKYFLCLICNISLLLFFIRMNCPPSKPLVLFLFTLLFLFGCFVGGSVHQNCFSFWVKYTFMLYIVFIFRSVPCVPVFVCHFPMWNISLCPFSSSPHTLLNLKWGLRCYMVGSYLLWIHSAILCLSL